MWTLPSQFLQPFSACRFGIETSAKICGLIDLQVHTFKTRHNLHGLDMLAASGAAETAFFVTSLAYPIPVVDGPSPTELTLSLISDPYHFYPLTAHQPVVIRKLPERPGTTHFLTLLDFPCTSHPRY